MAKRIFFETYDVSPPVGLMNTNNCVIRVPTFFCCRRQAYFPVRTTSYKMRELNNKLATVTKNRSQVVAQKSRRRTKVMLP